MRKMIITTDRSITLNVLVRINEIVMIRAAACEQTNLIELN